MPTGLFKVLIEEGVDGGPRPIRIIAVGHVIARRSFWPPGQQARPGGRPAGEHLQPVVPGGTYQEPPCVMGEEMK